MQQDLSIRVFQATDFGSNIGPSSSRALDKCDDGGQRLFVDFKAVEAVVDATHRYKEIFYESNE